MGMFDYVRARCPKCGGEIEEQSKAGPCELNVYSIYTAPITILGDLVDEEWWCKHCESRLRLNVRAMADLVPVDDWLEPDDG